MPHRPFRDLPEYHFWRVLHELADAHEDAVRRAIESALLDFAREVASPARRRFIRRALARGDIAGAIDALPFDGLEHALGSVMDELGDLLAEAGTATSKELAARLRGESLADAARLARRPDAQVAVLFGLENRRAQEWIREHGAALVREITEETRAAIRQTILRGRVEGIGPRAIGDRLTDMVGLTRRQSQAVTNFRRTLERLVAGEVSEDAVRAQYRLARDFGLTRGVDRRLDSLTERYRDRWIRHRSEMIARTETIAASSAGQEALWLEAAEDGTIIATEWEREWVAIVPDPDGRTCVLCEALDDGRSEIGGLFVATGTPGGIEAPPRHPMCRCATRLVRKRERARVAA
jgi:hypothetical protein